MGIFTKNKQKMDILQKAQENLELTQKNLSLLAAQNQESLSENQEVLQRTLTSIEAMLGKKIESVSCKKEYSDDEKRRAAYALNCCTISVSQIVDYDDIYVLEQEYEAILNNLNLENMPKDEVLLDIYKQLLDTITFFRIQEGDKVMMEQEYQHKVKNAIWSAVPAISLAGLAINPIGAAINLATQVGIGYMNYRREKAKIQSEQEKQKWQLTRSAMEQFNGLRRELFTTAWRLADKYKFADNLRTTEQQIAIFNKILLEPDDLKRYERLDYIKDSFEAYTPFLYHLGNAAYKASQNMCKEEATKYRKIARDSYDEYIKETKDAKLNLFRQDHIRAACALELFELNEKQECDTYLLDMAKDAAGSNFDVLEICALHYMQFEKTKDIAKKILRMLVNENYNAVVNGQILSSIYVSEYIKNPENLDIEARHNHETLQTRVNPGCLFPLPDVSSSQGAKDLGAMFIEAQKCRLLENLRATLTTLIGKYTIKFNQTLPATNEKEVDGHWYYSDDLDAIKCRIKEIEHMFSQGDKTDYISRLRFFIPNRLDVLNQLCIAMENFPYIDKTAFAQSIQNEVKNRKPEFDSIITKITNISFDTNDIPDLFKHKFSDLTNVAFAVVIEEFFSKISLFKEMKNISEAEALLRSFCIQEDLSVPVLVSNNNTISPLPQGKHRYISLDTLDIDAAKLDAEINKVHNMKTLIRSYIEQHKLVKDKEKKGMIILQETDAQFEIYRNAHLDGGYLTKYYGEPLLIICFDNPKTKNSTEDLIFTSKGIEYFQREFLKKRHHFPVAYADVRRTRDAIHIGNLLIKTSSETINIDALFGLIKLLRAEAGIAERDSQVIIKSNLTDKINEQIDQLIQTFEGSITEDDSHPVAKDTITSDKEENTAETPYKGAESYIEHENVSTENQNGNNNNSAAEICQKSTSFQQNNSPKASAGSTKNKRVGKYYGIGFKDAAQFAWMDTKYTVSKFFKKKS